MELHQGQEVEIPAIKVYIRVRPEEMEVLLIMIGCDPPDWIVILQASRGN